MNKPIIITAFATLLLFAMLTLYFLQGCQRDVEPIDDPVYNDFQGKVIALHFLDENGNALQGVSVQIKKDDQSPETLLENGSITYPVSEEGNYTFTVSKEGYVGGEHRVVVEFDCDVCGWFYEEELILTKIKASFVVESNSDKTYSIDGQTSVYFPKGCVQANTNVSITEVPTPLSQGRIEEKKGRIPLRSFYLTSSGGAFNKPITFSFPLDNLQMVLEKQTALYFGYVNDQGNWVLTPVMVNEVTKTGTVHITHFSFWELISDTKIEWGQESWSDWEEVIVGPCNEAVTVEYSKSFNLGLSILSALGVEVSGSVSGSSSCSAITDYQRIGYGRSKVALIYLYFKWPFTTEWNLYAIFEYPKNPVQIKCGSVKCCPDGEFWCDKCSACIKGSKEEHECVVHKGGQWKDGKCHEGGSGS